MKSGLLYAVNKMVSHDSVLHVTLFGKKLGSQGIVIRFSRGAF
jgi:hypothetical protein